MNYKFNAKNENKVMSVRIKVLIVVILVAVITTGSVLFFNIMQFSTFANETIDDNLDVAIRKTNETIKMMEAYTHSTAMFFAHDNQLITYVENKNRVLTTNRSMQLLRMLQRTGVETLTIINNEGIVISRAHTLATYGDDVSDLASVRQALDGIETVGVESLENLGITVYATVPMFDDEERVIGVLIAGIQLDTNRFVDNIKSLTNCEITVFKDDIRIATTLHDKNGERANGTLSENRMQKVLDTGFDELMRFSFQGQIVLSKHTPIIDSAGNTIGVISVGNYMTDLQNTIQSFILAGILVTALILFFTIAVIIHITKVISAEADDSIKNVNIDSLTGIHNRRYFNNKMEVVLKSLSRAEENWLTLMMIDIDCFKKYNDTYGHIKGDECLKKIAEILKMNMVRFNDFVARYGGEEFVIVLPNTDKSGAQVVVEKIMQSIRESKIPHQSSDVADYVTVSIGIVSKRVSHLHKERDYVFAADNALYIAKGNGKNQYEFAKE